MSITMRRDVLRCRVQATAPSDIYPPAGSRLSKTQPKVGSKATNGALQRRPPSIDPKVWARRQDSLGCIQKHHICTERRTDRRATRIRWATAPILDMPRMTTITRVTEGVTD